MQIVSADEKADRAIEAANRANQRLDGHEDLCAERYKGILTRTTRLEYILWGIIALLLIGDGTVLDLMKRLAGIQ